MYLFIHNIHKCEAATDGAPHPSTAYRIQSWCKDWTTELGSDPHAAKTTFKAFVVI